MNELKFIGYMCVSTDGERHVIEADRFTDPPDGFRRIRCPLRSDCQPECMAMRLKDNRVSCIAFGREVDLGILVDG